MIEPLKPFRDPGEKTMEDVLLTFQLAPVAEQIRKDHPTRHYIFDGVGPLGYTAWCYVCQGSVGPEHMPGVMVSMRFYDGKMDNWDWDHYAACRDRDSCAYRMSVRT